MSSTLHVASSSGFTCTRCGGRLSQFPSLLPTFAVGGRVVEQVATDDEQLEHVFHNGDASEPATDCVAP